MILPRCTVQCELEIRRHPEHSCYVPRGSDGKYYKSAAHHMQTPPGLTAIELPSQCQVNQRASRGKDQRDESFQHHAHTHGHSQQSSPAPWMGLVSVFIEGSLERPESDTDTQRHHHIGDEDSSEQEQTGASCQHHTRIHPGLAIERPPG